MNPAVPPCRLDVLEFESTFSFLAIGFSAPWRRKPASTRRSRRSPLPFLYESMVEETSFTNGLDPSPWARAMSSFQRLESLGARLDAELDRRERKMGAPPAPTLHSLMRRRSTRRGRGPRRCARSRTWK